MVREQVSVYGLTVIGERPRRASEIDPEAARQIFVREALLHGDRRLEAAFVERNEKLRQGIEERQAKRRRADLLAGESVRTAFYLERPAGRRLFHRHLQRPRSQRLGRRVGPLRDDA